MLGAYVVLQNPDGNLLLKSTRLLPNSFEKYAHRLDERDRELTTLLGDLVLQNLYKKFRRKEKSLQDFIAQFPENPHKRYIIEYIERRLAQAIPLLKDRNFYVMSKDGYPAFKQLQIADTPGRVRFHIYRQANYLGYRAEVEHQGATLPLAEKPGGVIGIKPAWIWHDDKVLEVEDTPDGRRLKPFFRKPEVRVPKNKEDEYLEKFVKRLIGECEVSASGFTIRSITESCKQELEVTSDSAGIIQLKPRVRYGDYRLSVQLGQPYYVELNTQPQVEFTRVRRDQEAEAAFHAFFSQLNPEKDSLVDLSLPEAKAHDWLVQNHKKLKKAGVEILQKVGEQEFRFVRPSLDYELQRQNGAFLLTGEVKFGNDSLPITAIRKNILKGEGKIALPGGELVFLPQRWLLDFRHLMEVARPAKEGLKIQPYHLSLLKVIFSEVPAAGSDIFQDFDQIEPQPQPEALQAELRYYQKAGYDWLCFLRKYHLGGILADDMGLGKTLQAITLLEKAREENPEGGPALVVVPNSLIYNWKFEAEKFAPNLRVLIYKGPNRHGQERSFFRYQIVLTSYGTLRQDIAQLQDIPFQFVILDESHTIKNRESKTAQAVLALNSRHRVSLTGTPVENTTMDLWTQMEFLNPGLLGTAAFFERHYAQPIEKDKNKERAEQLRELTRPFILRRTKDMVASDLPERMEQVQYCDMTPEQEKLYLKTATLYKSTIFRGASDESLRKNRMQVLSSIQRLRQIAIHPALVDPMTTNSGKYEVFQELLAELLQAGRKVLVFSQFVKLLRILKADLFKKKIPFSYLDGSMKVDDRAKEVQKFQEDERTKVFLISLKAGGVGLNLTAAEYVFLLDPWWNPAIEQQAIDRAHRIGQKNKVMVYRFITRDSIEEKILKLQQKKLKIAREVLRSEQQFFKNLSRADLESLFE